MYMYSLSLSLSFSSVCFFLSFFSFSVIIFSLSFSLYLLPSLPPQLDSLLSSVRDTNLRSTLSFGIGLHHAGLHERDRKLVEELFVNQKIQVGVVYKWAWLDNVFLKVLIATATLAWGVNFPAHLVIVKGTEYYDGKTHRYVDYPITDVLQMMGRAGR